MRGVSKHKLLQSIVGFVAVGATTLLMSGASALLPTAAGGAAPETIHLAFGSSIPTLDPVEWSGVEEQYPMSMIYDTLIEYNTTNSGLHPALAERYTISPDGKTYTFYLRPGVKFTNGAPLTAQDVIFSLNRVASYDPIGQGAAPYNGVYTDIVGYPQWFQSHKTATLTAPGMSGLTSPAPGVVQIQLMTPQPFFLNELALSCSDIIDPPVALKWGQNYELHAVGTGPYELKSWNQGHQMILVANPSSWRGAPKVAEIVMDENVNSDLQLLRFEQGQYDMVGGPLPSEVYAKVVATPSLKKLYHTAPMNGVQYFAFNTARYPFDNVNMRLAVNYAVNKALIIRDITNGRASIMSQPVPPLIAGYDPSIKPFPYDPTLAKEYLKKAGYKGQQIVLIYPSQTSDRVRLAEMLQQDMMAVGMNVKLVGMAEWGSFNSFEYSPKNNWDIAWYDWWQDYPDAQDFLENLLGTEMFNGTNVGNWTDPTFQKLVDTADSLLPDQAAARVADYQRASVIAHNQACWLFLYTLWQDDLVQPWIQPQPTTQASLMLYLHPIMTPQFNLMSTTR